MRASRFFFILLMSQVVPTDAPVPSVDLRTRVLADGWVIDSFASNSAGTVVVAGGQRPRLPNGELVLVGLNDGLFMVQATRFLWLAGKGDLLPGRPDLRFRSFAGIPEWPSRLALNEQDEVAFAAEVVQCTRADLVESCWDTPGVDRYDALLLYSKGELRTVALSEPTTAGAIQDRNLYDNVRLNETSMIAFRALKFKASPDGSSTVSTGLFLFSESALRKIALQDEPDPEDRPFGVLGEILAFNNAGDQVFTTTEFLFGTPQVVYRFAQNAVLKVLRVGSIVPGGTMVAIRETAANDRGDIVVFGSFGDAPSSTRIGLFSASAGGPLQRIVADGDASPAGGQFLLDYPLTRPSIQRSWRAFPRVNSNGDVVFVAPLVGASSEGGLFLWQSGSLRRLLLSGDPVPGSEPAKFEIVSYASPATGQPPAPGTAVVFDWSDSRVAAVAAFTPDWREGEGLFLVSEQGAIPVVQRGDTSPACEGCVFKPSPAIGPRREINGFLLSQRGEVTFRAWLCCGLLTQGVFIARPPALAVPNGAFEQTGEGDLSPGWTTSWSNNGVGDARLYNGGEDVAEGRHALRLHVSDGSVFVLSDPIAVAPDSVYVVSARLRYNLAAGNMAYFTVVDYDSSGRELGMQEIRLGAGDNFWTWQPRTIFVPTQHGSASVRIRVGLVATGESYLDVDDIR